MTNIYNFFKNALPKTIDFFKNPSVFIYLLAAILIAIPLKNIFVSIGIIVFVATSLFYVKRTSITFNKFLILPILFYILMAFSLLWTHDCKLTMNGLQKELPFLFIPLAFLFIPKINKKDSYKIFRFYSLSMAFYGLYYLLHAFYRYIISGNPDVFFYHELVTAELNAIYVSIFASFAVFYFVSISKKLLIDKIALTILVIVVFLLSSKSIITIDFILVVCYYSFFADIPKAVKTTTLITVTSFLVFSLVFVKEVKERFLLEYETAFVDNTVSKKTENQKDKVYNVSLKQAWEVDKFQQNHFFPGTAMRVYQVRIFVEMLNENPILFTGFGLEASQEKIKEKEVEHNLYTGYGDFNFHNQYVQTFSELGLFGFLLLLGMLHLNIKKAWKEKDFLHIAFAITMIILFLSESFFCRQRGIVFFITIYFIFNLMEPGKKNQNA
jgi:O-antigen ligase